MQKSNSIVFTAKDFFYNNGIVNFYNHLVEQNLNINMKLTNTTLKLTFENTNLDEIYKALLKSFLKDYKIVHQTKNERWYFDENKKDFILDKKFDVVGKASGNDILSGVYKYKQIDELGFSREEIKEKYQAFCLSKNLKPDTNVPNKRGELTLAIKIDEAIEKQIEYLTSDKDLVIDSKIHLFEDGQNSFHDMLKPAKDYKINRWDALIYWYGVRVQRFYNYSYFIYPNSTNLRVLQKIKDNLKINDNSVSYIDDKGKEKIIGTNINFYNQLSRDNIKNRNFYISKSSDEFEMKFFMYLFSYIFHIEDQYEKANKRRRKSKKELFEAIKSLSFVIYTDDGIFKLSLNEYTKAHQLIQFFEVLHKDDLFKYLADLMTTLAVMVNSKEVNLVLKSFCSNFLSFHSLRHDLYEASYKVLKSNKGRLGKQLFTFQEQYLTSILGGESMGLHSQGKIIGDGIGKFCSHIKDKDLLFKLRNVKNHKQLITYFKEVKFSTLKKIDKARFTKEFNETLQNVLEYLDESQESWELIRDYVAIYAIDGFKSAEFASTHSNKGA